MTDTLPEIYRAMLDAYGPQRWWPADGAFEMMIGAILIQHTAWPNARRAIDNLRDAGLLEPAALAQARRERVVRLIRPAGVYNVKAQRIKAFVRWYRSRGGMERLAALPASALRNALLSVEGIGSETADDILVYAFDRPVFVVDAYARRLFARYGLTTGRERYSELQRMVEEAMPRSAEVLGELHALIVEHAKRACRAKPLCETCCLRQGCARKIG